MASLSTQPNLEAEQGVIGSVLIDPDMYQQVAGTLKADDFSSNRHQWIWQTFTALVESKTAIDLLTVTNHLEQQGRLEMAGGADYLTKLVGDVPTSMHAEAYARLVLRNATARRTLAAATEIAKIANQPNAEAAEIVGAAQRIILELATGLSSDHELQSIGSVSQSYLEYLKKLSEDSSNFRGVLTHLIDLDTLLGGLRAPDLIIVAGRPGTGKTALMKSIAQNASHKNNKHIAFFSLEMDNTQVTERFMAQSTGIDVSLLHRGAMEAPDWPKLDAGVESFQSRRLFLDDTPAIWPALMRARLAKHVMTEGPLDLVIVDYLQLMQGDPGRKWNNRVEEVSYISRNLKLIAKEFKVPVLAGAQLSRAVEQRQDKKPILSDLRESGSIEQDSDIVIFLHPNTQPNVTDLVVSKHRQGKTGDLGLIFLKETTTFVSAETHSFGYD